MEIADVVVIGAGISGASLAHWCAKAGLKTVVLEQDADAGGCMRSQRSADGFWWELGAHTCYNSYGTLIDLLASCGGLDKLLPRQKAPFRLLVGDALRPIAKELSKLELLLSAPKLLWSGKEGKTVRGYYGPIVGLNNYQRVFSPLFAAVPSQPADDFPAEMLFKKRPRRKEILRSFTLQGGLQTAVDLALATPGISLRTQAQAVQVTQTADGWQVDLADGSMVGARRLVLAVSPRAAAGLLQTPLPVLAAQLGKITTHGVQSLGVKVAAEHVRIERVAGIVPQKDAFFSAVSRDLLPDAQWRGFTFHLRPGVSRESALQRMTAILGCQPQDLVEVVERRVELPSPVLGHAEVVAGIERALLEGPKNLYLLGNYFGGLAIEDCALRARQEASRLLAGTSVATQAA